MRSTSFDDHLDQQLARREHEMELAERYAKAGPAPSEEHRWCSRCGWTANVRRERMLWQDEGGEYEDFIDLCAGEANHLTICGIEVW